MVRGTFAQRIIGCVWYANLFSSSETMRLMQFRTNLFCGYDEPRDGARAEYVPDLLSSKDSLVHQLYKDKSY